MLDGWVVGVDLRGVASVSVVRVLLKLRARGVDAGESMEVFVLARWRGVEGVRSS